MGKSSGSESEGRVRYAKYIEKSHERLLDREEEKIEDLIDQSPFVDYEDFDIDLGFFGLGYVLASFPSLYDMYGKFMAGLDIEYLFNQTFTDTTDGVIVHNLISEQASQLSYDMENEVIPRYEIGMRDINAVMSGTFVIGRGMLETKRIQELNKFGAELRYKMIPVSVERWKTHLEWNKDVAKTYAQMLQLYIKAYLDVDSYNYEMHAKDLLWPFTLYEYHRSAIGAVGGGGGVTGVAGSEPSTGGKMLGGAMVGAAGGFQVGGPWGAAIGGVLGLAMGLF